MENYPFYPFIPEELCPHLKGRQKWKCQNYFPWKCAQKHLQALPYYFGYKMEFFSFQNNSKNLYQSYKTDIDLWECLGRVKHIL